LEKVRDQLSFANATCRELRRELHKALNESRSQQENVRSSVNDDEHEKVVYFSILFIFYVNCSQAIAKLELKLQQCRNQIKSLNNAANISTSTLREMDELKSKLEILQRSLDDKDKRVGLNDDDARE
jgi:flagellar biosynthesis chaperone FliJ